MGPGQVIMDAAGAVSVVAGVIALASALPRRLVGTCVVASGTICWGLGTILSNRPDSVATGWPIASCLLALAGVLLMLRRIRSLLDGARLGAEASMVASAALVLTHVILDTTDRPADAVPLTVLLLAIVLGILVALATRRSDLGFAASALGAGLLFGAEVFAELPGRLAAPSGRSVVGCAGWVLLLAGLRWVGRNAPIGSRTVLQMRPNTLASSLGLAVAVAAIVVVVGFGVEVDQLAGALAVAFLLSFGALELINGRQQKTLLERLTEQAATDPLTGLGNRRALSSRLARLHEGAGPVSVLTVDLDNFKSINTLLGHQVGDELLVGVTAAMRAECATAGAEVFRMGGDEFAVLVQASQTDSFALGERLIDRIAVAARAIPGAARVDVTASIGIADSRSAGRDGDDRPVGAGTDSQALGQLTRSGDAMRAAKAAGRARVLAYGGIIARQQHRHDALERRLRRAIVEDAIELHLQPIISLPEMRMVGMESLARWTDEELGSVSPAEFIAVAEDCGLIIELGMQLARRSMELMVSTGAHAAGLNGGVNVSPTQLRQAGFAAALAEMLVETGVEPRHFALEVTESVRIEADDPAVAAIWDLADLGMPVAIDDFGTGYASLSLIDTLPAKILKLDRSIIQRLNDPRGLAIARCVTDMTRALRIDVVAEGIETQTQLDAVRSLGVGFGQGWLFSKAVTPERFTEFVRDPDLVLAPLQSSRA